ncbi:3-deoxy-manno-octulosonate cytidylyltransferase [Klebsormidium nitens]|uniref:3-deoxy-manno-octulosonate cytidylyltransferase n=1 Tax=Klebsormidium nitens TaxID=105231 RepID=A0A1Y1HP26_KLENI|nr:3-deoxy-manno-octulosonate cytidylyltransferase [Klebsormidium nitens]|eukprot:GAQ78356.1 3-deoxy-manno-octulosonate cytidylyltransferase [Klebsormidium nitens]
MAPFAGSSGSSGHAALLLAFLAGAATAALLIGRQALFGRRQRQRVIGIIPARYASSRFPGKPLVQILGKSMIQRTYEQAKKATLLDRVVVATDDDSIRQECERFGAEVIMTSAACPNGTVRCHEALQRCGGQYDLVVNLQGDEPLVDPVIIDGIVAALQAAPDAVLSTAVTALPSDDVQNRNRVKCVVDRNSYALFFSRGMLPHNKSGAVDPTYPYLLHLGFYCFDAAFLGTYCALPDSALQLAEDLEQLKVLENGHRIKVIAVEHDAHGVDCPEDVPKIEELMRKKGIA